MLRTDSWPVQESSRAESAHTHLAAVLSSLFRDYDGPPFAVRLWDGWCWLSTASKPPACTLCLANAGALHSLLEASQLAVGEAFLHKDIDVEGDLFSAFAPAEHMLSHPAPLRERLLRRLTRGAASLTESLRHGPKYSERRDQDSIAYHYDQPVEFFRPWLGPTLVYSCAYFEQPDDSLDDAQKQKLELICRKLRLQPSERFLDVGCGWGSLILHATAHHHVCADGITLSRSQESVTSQRIEDHSLKNTCRVRLIDYRRLDPAQNTYDKIASVGMYEHVGLSNLPVYFDKMYRLLKPGGVFLNHGIARSPHSTSRGNDSFIAKWVFPDGYLVTLTEAIAAAEDAGFEVRDVENLREHYALTLRHWVRGLTACRNVLLQSVPELTYRIWLLYMAGCAAAFERGDIGVYQTLLSRPDRGRSGLPLTRRDWYSRNLLD
ncbi:MAG TPA: cyclopropane-fatty-acyl-phospholipid synthase family protein [Acidobacteriaceae bacterium]|nr:cyclopropane-fatty-acyl-phospholipid synthase family protein [Acidobacteriaceae bacterium]